MTDPHSGPLQDLYRRRLANPALNSRFVAKRESEPIHVVERGEGKPLIFLHGTAMGALVLEPILERLEGVRAIVPERPGHGLSASAHLARNGFRDACIDWIDGTLDALELPGAVLAGHSMGGLWSTWYAIARPRRVEKLILVGGAPGLPHTRCPFPFRMLATPLLGNVIQALPSNESGLRQFARFLGEKETLESLPDMIEMMLALDDDPVTKRAVRSEVRSIISAGALVQPRGWRPAPAVTEHELSRVEAPTLLIWGEREALGGADVAGRIAQCLPDSQLQILDAGHVPWWGHADAVARSILEFISRGDEMAK